MVRVAPINLTFNPRTLWFDPGDLDIEKDMPVVVRTARGTEFGIAASEVIEVSEEQVRALKSALRPVERIATEEDIEQAAEMERASAEALPVFKEMAREYHEDMHPVSVEFLLDGDKAVFYFEAEERIDFRELVRKLAARFHVRIDMRQIGVRDEARMVGGIGHCGQELCCKRLGGDFNPVSIRMAKEQDLSLNPQKISGLCGRLMCCLRYEYDTYKEFKSHAPKANATVQTPEGPAKVVELDVPRETVSLRVGDEKPVRVPLAAFDPPEEGNRPNAVSDEAWERAREEGATGSHEAAATFITSQFTGSDKLAEAGSVRRNPSSRRQREAEVDERRSSKGRGKKTRGGKSQRAGAKDAPATDTRKPRRRRSTKIAAGDAAAEGAVRTERATEAAEAAPARRSRHRSHAVDGQRARGEERLAQKKSSSRKDASRDGAKSSSRGTRGKAKGAGSNAGAQAGDAARADRARSAGPRPGQRSSGLAHRDEQNRSQDGAAAEGSQHRRSRRRSHRGGRGKGQGQSQGGTDQQ